MVQKLREILLTKYIGSMLIALLSLQAFVALVEAVLRTVFWFVYQQRSHSAFDLPNPPQAWDRLIFSLVAMVLYLLAAYGLARWLYPADPLPIADSDGAEESTAGQP